MKAQRVRIIAPIPGSNSVGIELPNENPSTVYLKNIINSEQYIKSKSSLQDLKRIFDIDNKCLGSGSFGKVYLAKNKMDPSVKFAVKEIQT